MESHILFSKASPTSLKKEPEGLLLESIELSFGSFGSMKEQLSKAAAAQFGSGWAWLVVKGEELEIVTTSNAGTPIKRTDSSIVHRRMGTRILSRLSEPSRRVSVSSIWEVIDWQRIEDRFSVALLGK